MKERIQTKEQTLRMVRHLAASVKPIMSSGVQTFTNGKPEFLARNAAKAVFPELGGPSRRTETSPELSGLLAC